MSKTIIYLHGYVYYRQRNTKSNHIVMPGHIMDKKLPKQLNISGQILARKYQNHPI